MLLLLSTTTASAQKDAPPEPPDLPSKPSDEKKPAEPPALTPPPPFLPPPPLSRDQALVRAHRPSPAWTQDRSFTSTRFWLLDPGNYEVEMWMRTRIPHEIGGVRGPAEVRWQHEIEIGVVPHLQIDLY